MKTIDLTNGERLLIQRRRDGLTQQGAAWRREVSLYCYRHWELDEMDPPLNPVGRLGRHESCLIHRRRAGISVAQLAEDLGVSRWWISVMEYGRACPNRLVEYWRTVAVPA